MSTFDSLTLALDGWFDNPLCDLPDALRQRVEQEFFSMPWDKLSADQRRSVALQLDYQHDPTTQQDQQYWFDFFEEERKIKDQIEEWGSIAAPTASDLAVKETRLAELRQSLAHMDVQKRQARGDYLPKRSFTNTKGAASPESPMPAIDYIAYPKAMHRLAERLGATPEELAAWIWEGQTDGGITAYLNANELDPPPRFYFAAGSESHDYIAPLMACWFRADEIASFIPAERYITGRALAERWSKHPGLEPVAFIRAKISESRLMDVHPIYGGTQGSFAAQPAFPPLIIGLFAVSDILQIEATDFPEEKPAEIEVNPTQVHDPDSGSGEVPPAPLPIPEVGSHEWMKENARAAANSRHDKPGGSREKRQQMRDLWATGKYSSRDLCAEQECAALNMSFSAARRALIKTPEPSRC